MNTYTFTIAVTFTTTVEVEAEDRDEALYLAQQEAFDAALEVEPHHYNIEVIADR